MSLAIFCGIKSSYCTSKILLSPKEGSLAIFLRIRSTFSTSNTTIQPYNIKNSFFTSNVTTQPLKEIWPLAGESKVQSLPLTQLLSLKERSLATICGIKSSFSTLKILLSPKEGSLAIFLGIRSSFFTMNTTIQP